MKERCGNRRCAAWKYYGGRGIIVCEKWNNDFAAFFKDMGECLPGLTLDRIDSDGNYEPGNCRWATRKQQRLNRKDNHYVSVDGKTMTVSEWSEKTGIKDGTIRTRLKLGWNDKRAVSEPTERGRGMAIYLQKCPVCGLEFEVERKMHDRTPVLCPKCDSKTERLIAGCTFHLKGSWSKDGYGK